MYGDKTVKEKTMEMFGAFREVPGFDEKKHFAIIREQFLNRLKAHGKYETSKLDRIRKAKNLNELGQQVWNEIGILENFHERREQGWLPTQLAKVPPKELPNLIPNFLPGQSEGTIESMEIDRDYIKEQIKNHKTKLKTDPHNQSTMDRIKKFEKYLADSLEYERRLKEAGSDVNKLRDFYQSVDFSTVDSEQFLWSDPRIHLLENFGSLAEAYKEALEYLQNQVEELHEVEKVATEKDQEVAKTNKALAGKRIEWLKKMGPFGFTEALARDEDFYAKLIVLPYHIEHPPNAPDMRYRPEYRSPERILRIRGGLSHFP
jgi:hypothetical protein